MSPIISRERPTHASILLRSALTLVFVPVTESPRPQPPVRHSTLVSWRPIAKDGFSLPPAQATVRPSIVNLPPGETADFEFTPERPGEVVLQIGPLNQPVQGQLVFRVRQ
jgi:hypothetical protein